MAKMLRIDCCDDCEDIRWPAGHNGGFCTHPGGKGIKITEPRKRVAEGCPLPDAEPAPYSESNPPKVGDVVQGGDRNAVGMIDYQTREHKWRFTAWNVCEYLEMGKITLLYRPPSGDLD